MPYETFRDIIMLDLYGYFHIPNSMFSDIFVDIALIFKVYG